MRRSFFLGAVAALLVAVPSSAQSVASSFAESPAFAGFGGTVTVIGDLVFVGEPRNVMRPGLVYVFEKEGDTWNEVSTFGAADGSLGDGFGISLGGDDGVLLVGASGTDGAGAVYVFEEDGGRWIQSDKLTATDGVAGDLFGASLAVAGGYALVGAPQQNDRAGAVHVFNRGGDGWTAAGAIAGGDVGAGDEFGSSVAFDGTTALVGAPRKESGAGAVYSFRNEGGEWTELGKVEAPGLEANSRFGSSLSLIEGNIAFVGAPQRGGGAVFTFELGDEGWSNLGTLVAFDGGARDAFGTSVALIQDELWVGAPRGNRFSGAVYVFRWGGEAWAGARKLQLPEGVGGRSGFGGAIAGAEGFAVVGIAGGDNGAGIAAVYADGSADFVLEATLASPAEGMDPITGGQVNCASGTAAGWDCADVDLVSFLPVSAIGGGRGVRVNDVWGWTDPENGREYALVGRLDGMAIVDISNTLNPVYVGELIRTEGTQPSTWRDMKVYQNHVFVVADGAPGHGVQVMDLTKVREFSGEPITFSEDAHYDGVSAVHNIVINEETGFAYAVGARSGGETCGGGLHIINVQEPLNPSFAGCFSDTDTGRSGTGYTHDGQCVTYSGPDAAYQGREICFGANETALSIADVTDKANTEALSNAAYPNVGYSHQGWLTDDQRFFYMNDELDELRGMVEATRTLIWDVSDLADPQLVGTFMGTSSSSDHNLYVQGNLMYQSNYQSGLRIISIADPLAPREVASFDTVPYGTNTAGFGGSWSNYPFFESGVILVTSSSEGLFVLKKRETVF